jgi:cation diffusion facilitator family transporter
MKGILSRVPHAKLALLSLGVALVTLVLKFAAYRLTGSIGLLSDAVESLVNVVAAATAFFALWYSSQPADSDHPYGHEKIDFFSSGIEGGLIFGASGAILWTSYHRFLHLTAPENVGMGVGVALVAAVLNFFTARALLAAAHRVDSIVLEADGKHLMSDVWTSVGVVLGLSLAAVTKLWWLDPLLAALVALNIARIGGDLVARSFNGLMDRALEEGEIQLIRGAIEGNLHAGMAYHALRTRRAGGRRFADYHLLVPGAMSVETAHGHEMEIEAAIEAAGPTIEVTSHIEPVEEPRAWNDSRIK